MIKNYFEKPITKRFIDAFPKFKRDETDDESKIYFWEGWQQSPFFDDKITEEQMKDCYYHLLASFYNWHFIYMDDLGISLNTYHIIHDYYPNALTRLDLVKQLRDMTLEEFEKSGITINSQGGNPKVATDMDKLIDLVDSQTANFQLKSKEQVLKAKFVSLYDGIFDEFVDRFKDCFVKLYSGVNSYLYLNPQEPTFDITD